MATKQRVYLGWGDRIAIIAIGLSVLAAVIGAYVKISVDIAVLQNDIGHLKWRVAPGAP